MWLYLNTLDTITALHKLIEFYVDELLRVPLRLAGKVPKVGRVALDLKAITIP